MTTGFRPDNFGDQLRKLEEGNFKHFLEGGQAVNIWAQLYSRVVPELEQLGPFTSKDCDIYASYELLQRIESILDGELVLAKDPADGQLGIFIFNGEPKMTMDLMSGVYGLSLPELERAWRRSLEKELGSQRDSIDRTSVSTERQVPQLLTT
ncbi:hypothetical protein [Luteolibacter luteus]|uniref:Uncharacterized protein n=1 Tax=Luteolibacter luteus TaxID=2728835 RepID=A0A858RRU3_9BACT|nr:hypothetical protein [Luteolibacter luteus]QJE99148.1 hypothetical protein HHL09_26325 [Luteolibacter luteus]